MSGAPSQTEAFPHFVAVADTPEFGPNEQGILVALGPLSGAGESAVWPLRGRFQLPRSSAGDEPMRRIVIALTPWSTHEGQVAYPVRDAVLFPEDVSGDEVLVGAFNFNLLDLFEFISRLDRYSVMVSIGSRISNVLTVEAEMPWIEEATPAAPEDDAEPADEDEEEEDEEDDDDSWMVDEDDDVELEDDPVELDAGDDLDEPLDEDLEIDEDLL